MKLVLLSSWPPRHCGIATYSADLVKSLREKEVDVHIICHKGDKGRKKEPKVHPVIDLRCGDWWEQVDKVVQRIKPDIVHVQHEYGLYNCREDNSSRLFCLFYKWKVEEEFPVVVTYHSIYRVLDRVQRFYMDVATKLTSATIVHEEYQKDLLPINIGRVPKNVFVIPHGAKDIKPYKNAKQELGLKGKKVVGLIGWWEESKGFDKVVKIWPHIRKELGKNAVLVVAGDARPGSIGGQIYKPKLLRLIKKSKAKDSIRIIQGAFTPEYYDLVLSSFDLMVLPYDRASQSGNLAHAFALGIPCVVSAMEGLKAEIEESKAGIAIAPDDLFELEQSIIRLMKNERLRKEYSKRATRYVHRTLKWSMIAKKHISLYEYCIKKLIEERESK